MSDFFGKLKSGAGKVAFEADKMGRLNKAKGELDPLKRQVETSFTKLGDLYYHRFINQEAESPAFAEICAQITEFERLMGVKNEDIQHINAEVYNPPGSVPAAPPPAPAPVQAAPVHVEEVAEVPAAPQTKFCTNCGKEMGITVKFCPDCGTKM